MKDDIQNKDITGAITQSRTLLEGVLKYAIDKKGDSLTNKEKLTGLIKKFEKLYISSDVQNPELRNLLKQLTGNLAGTIQEIGTLRNKFGDAHAGSENLSISMTYAIYIVNSTFSLSNLILDICKSYDRE